MRRKIELDILWQQAARQARSNLLAHDRMIAAVTARLVLVGTTCPLTLNEIFLDPPDLVARLAGVTRPA
jgi:hypothetical protein